MKDKFSRRVFLQQAGMATSFTFAIRKKKRWIKA